MSDEIDNSGFAVGKTVTLVKCGFARRARMVGVDCKDMRGDVSRVIKQDASTYACLAGEQPEVGSIVEIGGERLEVIFESFDPMVALCEFKVKPM